ncbi:MAG TPA: VOC family protein [Armatimonadota bacterium]|nr:VOC family protein [Armatimonadota bacterium]
MIQSLAHVAVRVSDLSAALDFYCGKLGLEEAFRLTRPDGTVWIVYLKCGNTTFIELFPGANRESRAPGDAVGTNHFCLQVDNVQETVEALKARGVDPISGPSVGQDKAAQAWYQDPDGNRFEIQQYLSGAMQLG